MTPEQVEKLNEQLRQTVQLVKSIASNAPVAAEAVEDLAAAGLAASIALEQLAISQAKVTL